MVPHRTGHRFQRLLAGGVLAAALAWPVAARGQEPDAFTGALARFTSALMGTYGDEGREAAAALDAMTHVLDEWDRIVRTYEDRLATGLAGADAARSAELHAQMGAVYFQRGRLPDALREFNLAAKADPHNVAAQTSRGVLLESAGRNAEAAAAFRDAWDAAPMDPALAYRVWQHRMDGIDASEASRALDVLSATYAHMTADRPAPPGMPFAQANVPDTTAPAPLLAPAVYGDAFTLLARGDYRAAVERFRELSVTDPLVRGDASESPAMRDGISALRRGSLEEARGYFESACAAAPSSVEARRLLGVTYWVDFEYDKSIEQLRAAVRLDARDERTRITLARVLTQADRLEDAADVLRETVDLIPGSALAHWWLASIHERLNRSGDAVRALEAPGAANVAAGRGVLYGTIGRLHDTIGDVEEALQAFVHRVRVTPNDLAAHAILARALRQQDRQDDAFAEFVAMSLIDPRIAEAHSGVGQIFLDAGRNEEAIVALQRAVTLAPDDMAARYALATAFRRTGRITEADAQLGVFHQLQTRATDDRRRRMTLDVMKEEAALRTAEGAHDRAAELWLRVVTQEPSVAGGYMRLGEALAGAGRTEAAIEPFTRAAALDGNPDAYRQLATLYARLGRKEESARARASYEAAQRRLFVAQGDAR